ncbi:PREDICTED: uncharacterized protein LOC106810857 [Priapulus caudatus]|uniref:Uncharacterized protein LOC106810857 n=1 Tax=Priapulus caudatus TaxID=37621 RepID=A0ABM1ECC2_PRICU|nr:PREDICTED: uncharacterized protein LOC106810857 [Priapulus caudatus]
MKLLLALAALAYMGWASPVEKRLGVPLQAEDDCNPYIGALNFSADTTDCQVFYICDHGWPKIRHCPSDTIWTPAVSRCMGKYEAVNNDCNYEAPQKPTATVDTIDVVACLEHTSRCNGRVECEDGSDEQGCASVCDPSTCRLPDCKCSDAEIPGGFLASEIPQMVLLAWDEALRVEDYNHLLQQILKKVTRQRRREPRKNPNGCPAVATFFTSHQFTDYAAVQSLYSEGNEFAAHSITKRTPAAFWAEASDEELAAEYSGQLVQFNNLAGIPPNDIHGIRSAYLQTKGNDYIKLMRDEGFTYDSSYATNQMDPPYWPYTFDYLSSAGCAIPPCVTEPVAGFWEIPLVDWLDTNDTLCENVDSCYFPADKVEALALLRSNFLRHYKSNKAPFTLNLRARWFLNDGYHNLEALQEFLDEIQNNLDVYLVTYSQALAWIKKPVKLSNILSSDVFACKYDDRTPLCEHPNLCGYYNITHEPNDEEHPGDRFFQTCADCPAAYPWVDNPAGTA